MESDDDFELFSPAEAEEPSTHSHGRKLKRLKRAAEVVSVDPQAEHLEENLPAVDAPNPADSGSMESMESVDKKAEEPSDGLQLPGAENGVEDDSTDFGSVPLESEMDNEFRQIPEFDSVDEEINAGEQLGDSTDFGSVPLEAEMDNEFRQIPEFDSVDEEINVGEQLGENKDPVIEASEEMQHDGEQVGPSATKKKKKRKSKGIEDGTEQAEATKNINKRREEKERRERMKQLRADSQRVLRETRDASFKPIPMVVKPISSVLEKIRQRKLEISKKTVSVRSANLASRYFDFSDEENVDFELDDSASKKGGDKEVTESPSDEAAEEPIEMRTVLDAGLVGGPHDVPVELSPEIGTALKTSREEFKPDFRAPAEDTQDLFSDYKNTESEELPASPLSPVEEAFAPSLPAMKLKFNTAHQISDDEEDNDKENISPHSSQEVDLSPPLKDPVKDFLDEEAEEEDDSDGDPFNCHQDDDEDDIEDAEELNDMIATNYEEEPIDHEMRNELHQKWLEQQEAAGMENLLQRIKGSPKKREKMLLEEEEEGEDADNDDDNDGDEDDEEGFEAADGLAARNLALMNLRKAKQSISEMFTDKDDPYVSSEDEESERNLTKQSLSEKMKGQTRLLSPAEDESSREVFSRIKKLNIMPESKKRAKPSALHDLSLASGKLNAFQKPSFLGRGSNSSLPKNQKTSTFRSFIFSRDDSNSKSTSSASEEPSHMVQKDTRPTKTPSAKFSSSQQTKSCTQTTQVSTEAESTTSLYEILRRQSVKSDSCVRDVVDDARAQSIFAAFKIGKRSREGRVLV